MSNGLKNRKRLAKKKASQERATKRRMDALSSYYNAAKEMTEIKTIVINFCDNGKTKAACGRCPVCLNGFDVEKAVAEKDQPSFAISSEIFLIPGNDSRSDTQF